MNIDNALIRTFRRFPNLSQKELQRVINLKEEEIMKRINDSYRYEFGIYKTRRQGEAVNKNEMLKKQYHEAINDFCGVGLKPVKIMLDRKVEDGDQIAELYRIAIEIECKNISAKQAHGMERVKLYEKKAKLIDSLVSLCQERDDVVYGYQYADNYSANAVIYFELPQMEQISFHTNLTRKKRNKIPWYIGVWDGQTNSTLPKIKKTLEEVYKEDIAVERQKVLEKRKMEQWWKQQKKEARRLKRLEKQKQKKMEK